MGRDLVVLTVHVFERHVKGMACVSHGRGTAIRNVPLSEIRRCL